MADCGLVLGGDDEYWTIRIPKPRRLLRWLRHVFVDGMRMLAGSSIILDVPLVVIISLVVGVLSFIVFSLVIRIPEIISLIFSVILVIIYLASTVSYFRR